MRIFYLILIIILSLNQAFAFETVSIPTESSYAAQNEKELCPITDEEFSQIEKIIFKKTYSNDSPQKRISRLEKEIFGMEQKGDYEDRFDNIITAADYYKSGYRKSENTAQTQDNTQTLNSKNYIQNYNFDDEKEKTYFSKTQPQKYYNDDGEKVQKKQSKIKQFFSDLADIFSGGVVTGYTPSMQNYGYDPYDAFTTIGGIGGISPSPMGVYIPRYNRYNSSYYQRKYYNYPPRHNYYNPPPPPRRNYYPSAGGYNSGAGVRIIH